MILEVFSNPIDSVILCDENCGPASFKSDATFYFSFSQYVVYSFRRALLQTTLSYDCWINHLQLSKVGFEERVAYVSKVNMRQGYKSKAKALNTVNTPPSVSKLGYSPNNQVLM